MKLWLADHLRFHIHYTPTSGSWLNPVERLFREVSEKCLKHRSAPTVAALEQAFKLAVALSRLHQLLLAEKEAVRDLDGERMDQLEAEIAEVLDKKKALLDQLRGRLTEHGS